MSKISQLPPLANPVGTETVVVLDGDTTRRAVLGALVAAAAEPALAVVRNAAANGLAILVDAAQGASVNDWILTLPQGLVLADGMLLQFDAPSTPDAIPTGADDGIRIRIGAADSPLFHTDGPAVGADAQLLAPWRVVIRYYAAGQAFILDRSAYEARRLQLIEELLARDDPYVTVGPDDARFFVSDFPAASTITRTADLLTIVRPVADAHGQRYAVPGARLRCGINPGARAGTLTFAVRFPGRNSNAGVIPASNPVEVLVDGVSAAIVASPVARDAIGYVEIRVPLAAARSQLVELIWPYGWEIELRWIRFPAGAMFNLDPATIPRPAKRIHFCGDSIVQGYSGGRTTRTFAWETARRLGRALVNSGYGGRLLLRDDGTTYAGENADLTVLIAGINNMTAQHAPADIYAEARGFVERFCAARPGAPLLVVTPFWNVHVDQNAPTYTGATYRAEIERAVDDAVTAIGAPAAQVKRISGLSLTANAAPALVADGTHLTDASHAQAADGLVAAITARWPALAS